MKNILNKPTKVETVKLLNKFSTIDEALNAKHIKVNEFINKVKLNF